MTATKFGKDFELDPQAYELRRGSQPIKLARIPMEILLLLVEHRPDLVTREQIIERVWGQGVFVDTNNSINGAIRKLRQALRDDPENPRLIATVTGKGYRFIAPMSASAMAQSRVVVPAAPVTSVPPVAVPDARASPRWPALLAAIVLVGTVGAYLYWSRSSAAPLPNERVMLAVLPFENLTGDAGQDYFSDGLTEEMISRLGNLAPQRLGIIARTSVMSLKSRPTLDEVGRLLGVQYVLEGSVRRDSENVRIAAQLIKVSDQTHVWARQYDRRHSEVLKVQAEIAQAIADQIELTFGGRRPHPTHPADLSPQALEAYDYYLKGRFFWNKRTRDGFQQAIDAFQQAIARNPDEARAYAGLADSYTLMCNYGFATKAEVIPKAREAASRALQLDEGLAAAHTSLALINEFHDLDWQLAESRFRRAIDLDMNYATAHHWYAEYLAIQGRFDEALAEIERARQLDPLSLIIATDRGWILYYARDYEGAIQQLRFVISIDPTFGRASLITTVYAQQGRFAEALAQIDELRKVQDGWWLWGAEAYVLGRAGRQEEARRALRKMEEAIRLGKVDPSGQSVGPHLGMGNVDEAFALLQEACEKNPSLLIYLKVDPTLDPLRGDPRFQELLRCARLDR